MRVAHWPTTAELLRAAAEKRGGHAFIYEHSAVLSGHGQSIKVSDLDADGILIEAGWTLRAAADCDPQPDGPPYGVELVEAIMDGHAQEFADITDTAEWVGVGYLIRSHTGSQSQGIDDPSPGVRRVSRTLPAWGADHPEADHAR
ncbi:MAG TPA: hypothetical protein VGJ44_02885 [Kribbellaceae bacterium]|jgi:hypothetical protein